MYESFFGHNLRILRTEISKVYFDIFLSYLRNRSYISGQLLEVRNKLRIKTQNMYVHYITIAVGWIIWYILVYELEKNIKKEMINKILVVLVALVILNMATNAMNLYYSYGNNRISETIELNTSMSHYEN